MFLAEQWKGFFKVCLWFLRHQQQNLLQMDFDNILHTLGDIIKSDLFILDRAELEQKGVIPDLKNLKKDINSTAVTNRLLQDLENEYKALHTQGQRQAQATAVKVKT